MKKLTREEIREYAIKLQETEEVIATKKVGNTYARQGVVGEHVVTWSADKGEK